MNYLLLILVGICAVPCIVMMFKKSKGHKETINDEHKENKHGGCCH